MHVHHDLGRKAISPAGLLRVENRNHLASKAAFPLLLQSPTHFKWGWGGRRLGNTVSIQTAPDKVCPRGWSLKSPRTVAKKTVELPTRNSGQEGDSRNPTLGKCFPNYKLEAAGSPRVG